MFFVVSLVVAIIPGFSASASWKEWLLFRNGGSFGVNDPQFGQDIGFFVFKLPFLSQVVDWAFGFLIVTTILVAVVHYLDGGIRIQPMGERVTPNAKRASVGAARDGGAGQGGRLLAAALRAHVRRGLDVRRRGLHRGEGPAAGHPAAVARVAARRGPPR